MKHHLIPELLTHLNAGSVIPAHPLSLNENRTLNESGQRLLTKYYIEAGSGGIAVGVHTTQFEIRKPEINLLESVLKISAEEVAHAQLHRPFLKIAGICGPIEQAIKEADLAITYGYHLGLLSMGGLQDYSEKEIIERAKAISEMIPVFGFYLQPSVGGRVFSYHFWNEFVQIPNVLAIKVAAFNRYHTLDVVRAICNSGRPDDIALYTGNDDNIVVDLMTTYRFNVDGKIIKKRFVGGLLGHWAVWTSRAVELLDEIKQSISRNIGIEKMLTRGIEVTDINAAIFDVTNNFKGCIPGIHEILHRQALLKGTWCLNPEEKLSKGQKKEIDRVINDYPKHNDDEFVKEFLAKNLKSYS